MRARRAARAVTASIAASDCGWWSGASVVERARAPRSTVRRRRATGPRTASPPCTTRWPTASIAPEAGRSPRAIAVPVVEPSERAPGPPTRRPRRRRPRTQLQAARARVDDEDPHGRDDHVGVTRRPGPVATSGGSSPCARVYAPRLEPLVDHRAGARAPARAAEARHPVDDVHHEVEPVEVVEHDHVERRRGRALLLVAADVEVGVVRPAVGEPVDQPRVAVVGEDDRLVGR